MTGWLQGDAMTKPAAARTDSRENVHTNVLAVLMLTLLPD
jgi:hypothetical protein